MKNYQALILHILTIKRTIDFLLYFEAQYSNLRSYDILFQNKVDFLHKVNEIVTINKEKNEILIK
jgi:hypothetical protein